MGDDARAGIDRRHHDRGIGVRRLEQAVVETDLPLERVARGAAPRGGEEGRREQRDRGHARRLVDAAHDRRAELVDDGRQPVGARVADRLVAPALAMTAQQRVELDRLADVDEHPAVVLAELPEGFEQREHGLLLLLAPGELARERTPL